LYVSHFILFPVNRKRDVSIPLPKHPLRYVMSHTVLSFIVPHVSLERVVMLVLYELGSRLDLCPGYIVKPLMLQAIAGTKRCQYRIKPWWDQVLPYPVIASFIYLSESNKYIIRQLAKHKHILIHKILFSWEAESSSDRLSPWRELIHVLLEY
jgi:hypothetical protein